MSAPAPQPNTILSVLPTLHLDQELGLDPPSRFALVLAPGAAEGVDLVDENDGGFVFPGQSKQVLHQPADRQRVSLYLSYCWCGAAEPHFSLSPSHLDTRSEEETEKKVELLASVATALAR